MIGWLFREEWKYKWLQTRNTCFENDESFDCNARLTRWSVDTSMGNGDGGTGRGLEEERSAQSRADVGIRTRIYLVWAWPFWSGICDRMSLFSVSNSINRRIFLQEKPTFSDVDALQSFIYSRFFSVKAKYCWCKLLASSVIDRSILINWLNNGCPESRLPIFGVAAGTKSERRGRCVITIPSSSVIRRYITFSNASNQIFCDTTDGIVQCEQDMRCEISLWRQDDFHLSDRTLRSMQRSFSSSYCFDEQTNSSFEFTFRFGIHLRQIANCIWAGNG